MESKIQCFRVRVLTIFLLIGRWLVSFLRSLFLSPHQSSPPPFLKFFPSTTTMSAPSVNINLSLPIVMGSQDEVWGHDSIDFFDGSNPLVRVVKCSRFIES